MNTEINSLSAISHLLTHRPERLVRIVFPLEGGASAKNPRFQPLIAEAKLKNVAVDFAPVANGSPNLARAWVKPFEYSDFDKLRALISGQPRCLVLALDHLQDPQNFGALLRSAEALGATAVIVPKDRGALVSQGVYHASVGAVETIPLVLVTNLGEALRKLKTEGLWVLGAALGPDAHPLDSTPDFERKVLVLGAEWEGLSPLILKLCDWQVEIPIAGKVQSLNVSAAGAILMYALLNPRGKT